MQFIKGHFYLDTRSHKVLIFLDKVEGFFCDYYMFTDDGGADIILDDKELSFLTEC